MFITKNGGTKWDEVTFPVKNFEVQHLSFDNSEKGWVIGRVSDVTMKDNNIESAKYTLHVLNTSDGGSNLEGWAAGNNVSYGDYIIHTKDGGKTWEQVYPTLSPTIDISFTDNQNGFGLGALTDQKALLRSFDGGNTWKSIYTFPNNCIPSAISFTDQLNGWVLTTDEIGAGVIWKTQDGGFT